MQRKRIRQEELFVLPSKSLGRERSISRSRDPSQNSRGDSSAQIDTFAYIPAHQRDRRIGESSLDSRQKEFYDRHREAESSRDRGNDYGKDRDRGQDYGKDRERDRRSGNDRDSRRAFKIPRKDAANSLPTRRGIDQTTLSECTQVDDDYTNVCRF